MKIVALLFCLICNLSLLAQKQGRPRVDSLLAVLNTAKDDKDKLDLYVQIMTAYNDFDKMAGLKLEKPAMDLATKMDSKAGIADVKNVVGRIHWRLGNFDVALDYHHEAKLIFEQANNAQKVALTIRYIGQDFADGGYYPEALKHFYDALDKYKNLGDRENMGYLYDLLAWVYGKQGNYVEAAKNGYLSLSLFEELGDERNIALAASDIADYYVQLGNYSEALKYFKQSEAIDRAKGDRLNLGYNHVMVGRVYQLMGQYSKSLKYHKAALTIGRDTNDPNIAGKAFEGMAEVYKTTKEYPKALQHYLSSSALFKKWSNRRDLAKSYCFIGDCYRILGKYRLSKVYYDSAFTLATALASKSLLADYYHGVETLDSAMNNWRGAYLNHKKYIINRDSVFNESRVQKMMQLKMNYEFNKKEAAIKAEQQEKNIRQRNQFLFLGIIVLLILILTIVSYKNKGKVTKLYAELKQKSDKLEEENSEKSSILNIVSHDLKAPFNKIKGLIDLMEMTDDLKPADKKQYINYIKTSVDQGNYLINKLLEAETAYNETKPLFFESTNLVKFIDDFRDTTNVCLFEKQQQLKVDVRLESDHALIDQPMLTRILDNLVSNASKFSDKGKSIYLKVWSTDQYLNFSVRDEGPGISEDDQKVMFKKFQKLKAQPTGGESSTGLGLSIIKAIIEKLGGSIRVMSKLGEGTEVVVSFQEFNKSLN
ncbi:MAG TPA: tetratricopeptide repeat-containing sensor histidine kinase [Cyclobacteriaceae bacterium]|jgi:signal transduction histidine kinase|nr:tetratricopeptide repeat-containing sensor histidine kinase [Cyclobacteriaceae bacterium]